MTEKLFVDIHITTMLTSFSSFGGFLAFLTTNSIPTGIILTLVLFVIGQAVNAIVQLVVKPWLEERRSGEKKKLSEENERLKRQLALKNENTNSEALNL